MQFPWITDLHGQVLQVLYFGGISTYPVQYLKSDSISHQSHLAES